MMQDALRARTWITLHAALWAVTALSGPAATAAQLGPPLFGQAGAALVPGADAAAAMKQGLPPGAQNMANNFNKAGTADAAAPAGPSATSATPADGGKPSSFGLSGRLVKYAPSYLIMVLAISLGLFVVCRPAGFSVASLAEAKKPKK